MNNKPRFKVTYWPGSATCGLSPHKTCYHATITNIIYAQDWAEANRISGARHSSISDGTLIVAIDESGEEMPDIVCCCKARFQTKEALIDHKLDRVRAGTEITDFYTYLAAQVLKIPTTSVTSDQRTIQKNLVHPNLFGAFGLEELKHLEAQFEAWLTTVGH